MEEENPKLKNVLNKNYTQLQIDSSNLAGLINLIATIPFLLTNQFAKSVSLERTIKANLKELGNEFWIREKRNPGPCLPHAAEEGTPGSTERSCHHCGGASNIYLYCKSGLKVNECHLFPEN